jgi:hypothetical protein
MTQISDLGFALRSLARGYTRLLSQLFLVRGLT